jgi:hypothetical protein
LGRLSVPGSLVVIIQLYSARFVFVLIGLENVWLLLEGRNRDVEPEFEKEFNNCGCQKRICEQSASSEVGGKSERLDSWIMDENSVDASIVILDKITVSMDVFMT